MGSTCWGCGWEEGRHSGGPIGGLEGSEDRGSVPAASGATAVRQAMQTSGWCDPGAEVNKRLCKSLASSFSRTPPRLPPSRKCLMRVVGPRGGGGAPWGWGTGGPPGLQPARSCRQGAVPSQLWEAPSWAPGAGAAPWNAQMWRRRPRRVPSCPVVSCPVWAALSSLPAQARQPRADTRCLREQRLPAPPHDLPSAPPPRGHPGRGAPTLSGSRLGWGLLDGKARSHTWSLRLRKLPSQSPASVSPC